MIFVSSGGISRAVWHGGGVIDRLRLISARKTRITMMLDNDLLVTFRAKAEAEGIGYQTLINRTLRHAFGSAPVGQRFLTRAG